MKKMKTDPRIFVSVPDDHHLDERRKSLKRTIIRFIKNQGFEVTGFEPEQFGAGLPTSRESWTVDRAKERIRRCDGVLILALARLHVRIYRSQHETDINHAGWISTLPTPYNHLEGALALAQELPVLIIYEEGMDRSGIFNSGIKPTIIPTDAGPAFTRSQSFKADFKTWADQVRDRRDVFLGYCSKANSSAKRIRKYLESQGFTVLDWSRDFRKGGATILDEIERAARRCRCAVFLFTKDDELDAKAKAKASASAIPRDNVLLEAGYFTQARGKQRVAIIRERGAKMPADLGGIIYLSLENRNQLLSIKRDLRVFLKEAL